MKPFIAPSLKKSTAASFLFRLMVYLLLTGLAFVFIFPFISMLVDSFKSYNDISNNTVKWIPHEPTLQNYSLALEALNVWKTSMNSLLETAVATAGHLISCSLVAYGFARFRFPLRNVLFGIVVLSILIPTQTIIIPSYIIYTNLHMTDSILPMVIPAFFGFGLRGGIFIFIFRQYFLRIPRSIEEAASIEGCGPVKTFLRIVLPTTGATMVVCLLLSVVWHWNDSYEPSIYLTSYSKFLLPQMLSILSEQLSTMQSNITNMSSLANTVIYHKGTVMAATTICLVPLFVFYMFMQRKFVEGVERSGLVE